MPRLGDRATEVQLLVVVRDCNQPTAAPSSLGAPTGTSISNRNAQEEEGLDEIVEESLNTPTSAPAVGSPWTQPAPTNPPFVVTLGSIVNSAALACVWWSEQQPSNGGTDEDELAVCGGRRRDCVSAACLPRQLPRRTVRTRVLLSDGDHSNKRFFFRGQKDRRLDIPVRRGAGNKPHDVRRIRTLRRVNKRWRCGQPPKPALA
jgi:hypothetical protein